MGVKLVSRTEGGIYVGIFLEQDVRKKFGTIKEEVIENWVKLQKVELHSSNLLIKDNRMGGAWGIYGGREIHTDLWRGNLKERTHL